MRDVNMDTTQTWNGYAFYRDDAPEGDTH